MASQGDNVQQAAPLGGGGVAAAPAAAPQSGEEYRPKCILLTGGAGFIGSHVAIRLVKRFPDVRVSLPCS